MNPMTVYKNQRREFTQPSNYYDAYNGLHARYINIQSAYGFSLIVLLCYVDDLLR